MKHQYEAGERRLKSPDKVEGFTLRQEHEDAVQRGDEVVVAVEQLHPQEGEDRGLEELHQPVQLGQHVHRHLLNMTRDTWHCDT